jgi:hypothetical protein
MRLFWDAFPNANPLKVALEALKGWNFGGLRWLLDHKAVALSHVRFRLLKARVGRVRIRVCQRS